MSTKNSSESVKNICDIIEQRDLHIFQTRIKIKYLKDLKEKVIQDTKELLRKKEKIEEDTKFVSENVKLLELVYNSLQNGNNVALKCLINYQTFDKLLAEDQVRKEEEVQKVQRQYRDMYKKEQDRAEADPLYQQLQNCKEKLRTCELQLNQREIEFMKLKKDQLEKYEIKKQKFYTAFVDFARMCLNRDDQSEVSLLTPVKMNRIKDSVLDNSSDHHALEFHDKYMKRISEILESEATIEEPPPKIQVLNQQIIMPVFQEKMEHNAKKKRADIFRRWKKMKANKTRTNHDAESVVCSQESLNCTQDTEVSACQEISMPSSQLQSGPELKQTQQIHSEPLVEAQQVKMVPIVSNPLAGTLLRHGSQSRQQNNPGHGSQSRQQNNPEFSAKLNTQSVKSTINQNNIAVQSTAARPDQNKIVRFNVEQPRTSVKLASFKPTFMEKPLSSFLNKPSLENQLIDNNEDYTKGGTELDTTLNETLEIPFSPERSFDMNDMDEPNTTFPFSPVKSQLESTTSHFSFGKMNFPNSLF